MSLLSISQFWRLLPWLLLLGPLFALHLDWYQSIASNLLQAIPYVFAAILAAVSLMFNRSRFVLPVFLAVSTFWVIQTIFQQEMTALKFAQFQMLHCVLAIGLVLCAVMPEKGARHPLSIACASIIALGLYGVVDNWFVDGFEYLRVVGPGWIEAWSEQRFWISPLVVLSFCVGAVLITLALWVRRDVATQALLLTLVASAYVVWDFNLEQISALMYGGLLLSMLLLFLQNNYQVTYMDALTGIPGRRSLEDYLPTLGRRYAIAMLDVDHFKKFNDTHGHDVGDQVLKMVAAQVNRVQGGGRAFRYGGEEFTVVFPRSSAQECYVFLEAIRDTIANYQLVLRSEERADDSKEARQQRGAKAQPEEKSLSVTISIGVASSESGLTPQEIIKKADDALYAAKQAGRNQTVKSGEEPALKPKGRAKKAA